MSDPVTGGAGDALDDAVARLARGAHRRNMARAHRVVELLGPGAEVRAAVRDEVRQLCHAIAGSAGTFGDDGLAEAARDLQSALEERVDVASAVERFGVAVQAAGS